MNNQEIIWFNGEWSTTDKPAIGITDHALWMASTVFDGARSVKGHLPREGRRLPLDKPLGDPQDQVGPLTPERSPDL